MWEQVAGVNCCTPHWRSIVILHLLYTFRKMLDSDCSPLWQARYTEKKSSHVPWNTSVQILGHSSTEWCFANDLHRPSSLWRVTSICFMLTLLRFRSFSRRAGNVCSVMYSQKETVRPHFFLTGFFGTRMADSGAVWCLASTSPQSWSQLSE